MKGLDLEDVRWECVNMLYLTRADYLVEGRRAKIRVSLFTKYHLCM